MTHLNSQDIEILLDALDAWIDKDSFANAINDVVDTTLADRQDPAARATFEKRRQARILEATVVRETRKRFAALLKTKLYAISEAKWMGRDNSR